MSYPAGVELYREADLVTDVFYLEHGLVKLQRLHPAGQEVIIGLRSAGWFLCASSAVLERPLAATGITVTSCRIARVKATNFRERVRTGGALSWAVHRMHCEELQAQMALATDLARPATERLRGFLRRIATGVVPNPGEPGIRCEIPLRQWEIAQLIRVTPPYLSQLLGELEGEGQLQRNQGTIILIGPEWTMPSDA